MKSKDLIEQRKENTRTAQKQNQEKNKNITKIHFIKYN